ncbi:MAG TPA: hypothetical protein VNT76_21770 [Candidatus Binatus sp.]|nr:hypothetical protein [Candidatus Binatus sp.]
MNGSHSARFIAGTVLIASSFLVYLAYPIILLIMPFSGTVKVTMTFAVWALSWAVFSAGMFLTGPEGYRRFKAFWSRNKNGSAVNKTI